MSLGWFKDVVNKVCLQTIYIYLELNNLQWLICHKAHPNQPNIQLFM